MTQPKKWHDVYPYGTKEGEEEAQVFRSLSRNKKYDWRSTAAIVKTTGLSRERVEEIIDKYVNKFSPSLIYSHPTNEDHWGYWERVPECLNKDTRNISKKDKDGRITGHIATSPSLVTYDSNASTVCDKISPNNCSIVTFGTYKMGDRLLSKEEVALYLTKGITLGF